MLILESDEAFFQRNPRRQIRIRRASKNEMDREFAQVTPHTEHQRRIIAWRVPHNVPAPFAGYRGRVMRIPFVQEIGEEIDDTDRALMPILEDLMNEASKEYGLGGTA
jgi:hypothetical protein